VDWGDTSAAASSCCVDDRLLPDGLPDVLLLLQSLSSLDARAMRLVRLAEVGQELADEGEPLVEG
jgi:hypothetical protein